LKFTLTALASHELSSIDEAVAIRIIPCASR